MRFNYIVKVTPRDDFPERYYLEYFETEQDANNFIDFILTTADEAVMIDSDEGGYKNEIQRASKIH